MIKYIFTGETHPTFPNLRRIKRISDDLIGGWIESEDNLSHEGSCFIYNEARAHEASRVTHNASLYNQAAIFNHAHIRDDATLQDDATAHGEAVVAGSACLYRHAVIGGTAVATEVSCMSDYTYLGGNSILRGHARMEDRGGMEGKSIAEGYATIRGSVLGSSFLTGNAFVPQGAKIRGAALISTMIRVVNRSDGFLFTLYPTQEGIYELTAGCRHFTLPEARQHWQRTRSGTPLGHETFDILEMFERHVARNPL